MPVIYKTAPERMTAARWKLRLKQKDIAKSTCLSLAYVSDLFSGKRGLSARSATLMGKALGLSPRNLLIAQIDEELENV